MFKTKPSIYSLRAQAHLIAILENQLDSMTDKIANDTITPDEIKYAEELRRMRGEAIYKFITMTNRTKRTKRSRLAFWNKVATNHFSN